MCFLQEISKLHRVYLTLIAYLQLSAFVKYIVFDFNKRRARSTAFLLLCTIVAELVRIGWHEEQKADCKTPVVSIPFFPEARR